MLNKCLQQLKTEQIHEPHYCGYLTEGEIVSQL